MNLINTYRGWRGIITRPITLVGAFTLLKALTAPSPSGPTLSNSYNRGVNTITAPFNRITKSRREARAPLKILPNMRLLSEGKLSLSGMSLSTLKSTRKVIHSIIKHFHNKIKEQYA